MSGEGVGYRTQKLLQRIASPTRC